MTTFTAQQMRDMADLIAWDELSPDDIRNKSAAMLRQAASDREDAERYRFVKEHTKAFENYFGCEYKEICEAIDKALQESRHG